jgi:hypothetical protein
MQHPAPFMTPFRARGVLLAPSPASARDDVNHGDQGDDDHGCDGDDGDGGGGYDHTANFSLVFPGRNRRRLRERIDHLVLPRDDGEGGIPA